MSEFKLIALDLDGTLLDREKRLSDANLRALARAAEAGIEIVPTTGRFFDAMPEPIRTMPFLHYAITINGAAICDVRRGVDLAEANIPLARALKILRFLDGFPVIYDCYQDNAGWMTRAMWERAADFAPNVHTLAMLRTLRTPVPDLKSMLIGRGRPVQKIQLFLRDLALRDRLLRELGKNFVHLSVTSSVSNNIEINDADANKGAALKRLTALLDVDPAKTLAFGDGLNDITLLKAAGFGVAMGNSVPELLSIADAVTGDCDQSGVAEGIERFCL